ncbi:hypothetical protein [Mycobacterium sp. TY814]|uniref:hypothetical protein n=1 Tax=unclassified Mycobacterium TaxID=2642494 RepID=UPI002740C6B0|nr:hypothetical protein [Mycobacterium sp. TY814]MDP7725094.1 hypothetical protein [Mycobacterium sp. TY814]
MQTLHSDEPRFNTDPALAERRRLFIRHTEVLAHRLLLAFLEDDPAERALQVLAVANDSGIRAERWELSCQTAMAAANFWRQTDAELGRRLILARLLELTEIDAA